MTNHEKGKKRLDQTGQDNIQEGTSTSNSNGGNKFDLVKRQSALLKKAEEDIAQGRKEGKRREQRSTKKVETIQGLWTEINDYIQKNRDYVSNEHETYWDQITDTYKNLFTNENPELLRAYPNNPAQRKAIKAQAKWRKAR